MEGRGLLTSAFKDWVRITEDIADEPDQIKEGGQIHPQGTYYKE
jgi:hypothetical protein